MPTTNELGSQGERIAVAYLTDVGLRVLDRNWRCREGELDIVAREGDALVFCEVKTRSSEAFGAPVEAITYAKRTRLRHLAAKWLEVDAPLRPREIRFDVASVLRGEVEVLEGAF